MKTSLTTIFFLISILCFSQDSPKLRGKWKKLKEKANSTITNPSEKLSGKKISYDEKYKEYWDNGKIKYEPQYNENEELDGQCKSYYESGLLKSNENYLDGKLNGSRKTYYENGKLESDENYLDGKLNGSYKTYYANGQLEKDENYLNEELNGSSKHYYENGKLGADENYLNGKLNGICKYYVMEEEGENKILSRTEVITYKNNEPQIEKEWYVGYPVSGERNYVEDYEININTYDDSIFYVEKTKISTKLPIYSNVVYQNNQIISNQTYEYTEDHIIERIKSFDNDGFAGTMVRVFESKSFKYKHDCILYQNGCKFIYFQQNDGPCKDSTGKEIPCKTEWRFKL